MGQTAPPKLSGA